MNKFSSWDLEEVERSNVRGENKSTLELTGLKSFLMVSIPIKVFSKNPISIVNFEPKVRAHWKQIVKAWLRIPTYIKEIDQEKHENEESLDDAETIYEGSMPQKDDDDDDDDDYEEIAYPDSTPKKVAKSYDNVKESVDEDFNITANMDFNNLTDKLDDYDTDEDEDMDELEDKKKENKLITFEDMNQTEYLLLKTENSVILLFYSKEKKYSYDLIKKRNYSWSKHKEKAYVNGKAVEKSLTKGRLKKRTILVHGEETGMNAYRKFNKTGKSTEGIDNLTLIGHLGNGQGLDKVLRLHHIDRYNKKSFQILLDLYRRGKLEPKDVHPKLSIKYTRCYRLEVDDIKYNKFKYCIFPWVKSNIIELLCGDRTSANYEIDEFNDDSDDEDELNDTMGISPFIKVKQKIEEIESIKKLTKDDKLDFQNLLMENTLLNGHCSAYFKALMKHGEDKRNRNKKSELMISVGSSKINFHGRERLSNLLRLNAEVGCCYQNIEIDNIGVFLTILYASLDVYDLNGANTVLALLGDRGNGKSYTVNKAREFIPSGCTGDESGSESNCANNSSTVQCMGVIVHDEMPPLMTESIKRIPINMRSKVELVKAQISMGIDQRKILVMKLMDSGDSKRTTKNLKNTHKLMKIYNTNYLNNNKEALNDRYWKKNVLSKDNLEINKNIVSSKSKSVLDITPQKAFMHDLRYICMWVNLAIYMGGLTECNFDLQYLYYIDFLLKLKKKGISEVHDSRPTERVMKLNKQFIIVSAVLKNWFSEKGQFYNKPFHKSQIKEIEKDLYSTVEACFYSISFLHEEYENIIMPDLLMILKHNKNYFALDTDIEKQFMIIDGDYDYGSDKEEDDNNPSEKHKKHKKKKKKNNKKKEKCKKRKNANESSSSPKKKRKVSDSVKRALKENDDNDDDDDSDDETQRKNLEIINKTINQSTTEDVNKSPRSIQNISKEAPSTAQATINVAIDSDLAHKYYMKLSTMIYYFTKRECSFWFKTYTHGKSNEGKDNVWYNLNVISSKKKIKMGTGLSQDLKNEFPGYKPNISTIKGTLQSLSSEKSGLERRFNGIKRQTFDFIMTTVKTNMETHTFKSFNEKIQHIKKLLTSNKEIYLSRVKEENVDKLFNMEYSRGSKEIPEAHYELSMNYIGIFKRKNDQYMDTLQEVFSRGQIKKRKLYNFSRGSKDEKYRFQPVVINKSPRELIYHNHSYTEKAMNRNMIFEDLEKKHSEGDDFNLPYAKELLSKKIYKLKVDPDVWSRNRRERQLNIIKD